MIFTKNTILIFALAFSLFSCKNNREKRKEIVFKTIEEFSQNEGEWNNLTQRILKNEFVNSNLGMFINPIDLEESLASALTKKGISQISVQNNSECKEVEYITEWTNYPIGTLYLTWTTCNVNQTTKGYYKDNFHVNFIEVWGIGNNWLIWTDSDFI